MTVNLTGVAAGTTLGALDLTIDYDATMVSFNTVVAGGLTTGALVTPNDNGDTVKAGVILATGFDGGASGSVMVFTFDVIQPNIPAAGDFSVTAFSAFDLMGADARLDTSNISINVVNQ